MKLLSTVCIFALSVGCVYADVKDAIVKIYTIQNNPDYYNPWSMRGPSSSTGSGAIIKGKKILTNAHVVGNQTFLQVRRYGDPKRYEARLLSVSHEADLALLTVDDESFFENTEPLEFGDLPEGQQEVLVYGFPLGGDTLSITRGVVSRIEHQIYVHSSCYLLAGQIDAAINPGNSGGPVLMDGKIAGVVMQGLDQADNIGYMVPVNIIRHFFKDIEDGSYDGFPSLGVVMQGMENPDLKTKYGVAEDQTGMLLIKILPDSPADAFLDTGDVLFEIDGHPVADDGTVEFRPRQRTSISYFIQEHQIGDTIKAKVLRSGEKKTVELNLKRAMQKDWLVPMEEYDVLPSYYIYGGVVFMPLTKNLLEAWGPNWYRTAPAELLSHLSSNFPEHEGQEVILVLKVLPADLNRGYHNIANWVVQKVDGKKVKNLKELIGVVENSSTDPYVIFENSSGQQIVLDRATVAEKQAKILTLYRIADDRSSDLKE